jgi:surfeit locus 1 family protein
MTVEAVMRRRSLVLPAAMTAVMVAILLALGTWQVQRLHWKRELLAAVDRAETSPPVALPADPAPFTKVIASGHYLPQPQFLYSVDLRGAGAGPQTLGAWVLALMQLDDGRIVAVDRGWAPQDAIPPVPEGEVTVTGFIRPDEHPAWFTPADELPKRHLYTLNAMTIARALNVVPAGVQPYTLVALGKPGIKTPPIPSTELPRPPNDHLSYALTWYSFAAILTFIFIAYARKSRAA